jgi:hypothetical protein
VQATQNSARLAAASLTDNLSPVRGGTAPLFHGRVPDTFQLGAISVFLEFCASGRINNSRVFNAQNIPTPPASTILF